MRLSGFSIVLAVAGICSVACSKDEDTVSQTDVQGEDSGAPAAGRICEVNADCKGKSSPFCDPDFQVCVECIKDSHCAGKENVCSRGGQCVSRDCDPEAKAPCEKPGGEEQDGGKGNMAAGDADSGPGVMVGDGDNGEDAGTGGNAGGGGGAGDHGGAGGGSSLGGTAGNGGTGGAALGGSGGTPQGGAGGTAVGGTAGSANGGTGGAFPPTDCSALEIKCENGMAGEFPCSGVNLLAHLTSTELGGGNGADLWGWTDPMTKREYALVALTNGTAFVDVSDPCRPVHLGHLKTETSNQIWRDVKVYKNHAYIVSEAFGHGMQVFDLTQLRTVVDPPQVFKADKVVGEFRAHNIVINEESGFAYATLSLSCLSGWSFDLATPSNPVDAGCWNDSSARLPDAQCVNYHGPDAKFAGKEICVAGNEGAGLRIYDVTDKSSVVRLSSAGYQDDNYANQAWFTEDHRHLLLTDSGDELRYKINTTVYIFDVSDLTRPVLAGTFVGSTEATDHNIYVRKDHAFLASYAAGVRILDITNIAQGTLSEVGYFDTYPRHNNAGYADSWSNYPFFRSGVLVTSGAEGLFVLRPDSKFMQ